MRARQRDIDWYETQIDKRKTELEDLQNRLYDAEKLLVSVWPAVVMYPKYPWILWHDICQWNFERLSLSLAWINWNDKIFII